MDPLRDAHPQQNTAAFDAIPDGFLAVDSQGLINDCNSALCTLLGFPREELLSRHIADLHIGETEASIRKRLQILRQHGNGLFEATFRHNDGRLISVEVSISCSPEQREFFLAIVRDIHERKLNHGLVSLRSRLADHALERDPMSVVQAGTEAAARILESQLSLFAFVNTQEDELTLSAWSLSSRKGTPQNAVAEVVISLSQSGKWLVCVQRAKPVISNNASGASKSEALPGIDADISRLLIVPVLREEQVVALMAVVNRSCDYHEAEISTASQIAEVTYDYYERCQLEQRIDFLAFRDPLTGLPNRKLLDDRLRQSIAHARRSGKLLAICYLDLDGFKPINDRYGHGVGDRLLVAFARRLTSELREEDTLARIGGDEFIVLINDLDSILLCEQAVHRLLESIGQPFFVDGRWLWVTASIGATIYPDDEAEPNSLIRHADQAMYRAKESGKNTITLYDTLADRTAQIARSLKDEFKEALKDNSLTLEYQPRIDLLTGQLAGVEALIRWHHPSRGLLRPKQFLPTIKDSSDELELDKWVLRHAAQQHMAWRNQGLFIPISINLSPYSIQHRSFPKLLARVLADGPKDLANYLEFEVLESGAISDVDRVSEVMFACIDQGVKFSLDDFGTGYSSLSYFHKLPIELLKIDQAFVRDMLVDPRDRDIVEGVVRLAEAIGRPVVAEGVESPELGIMLLQIGCRYAQGFSIARPLPPESVPIWDANWNGNFLWKRVLQYRNGPTVHYDVNVAILSHRFWLQKLQSYLESDGQIHAPELDENRCQFASWLNGIGGAKFASKAAFPTVRALHNDIHQAARQLERDFHSLSPEERVSRFANLSEQSYELEHTLLSFLSENPQLKLA